MEQTYEYGLIVGTKREREYWKNKINRKIEKLNKEYNKTVDQSKNLIKDLIGFHTARAKIQVLKELQKNLEELLGDD